MRFLNQKNVKQIGNENLYHRIKVRLYFFVAQLLFSIVEVHPSMEKLMYTYFD